MPVVSERNIRYSLMVLGFSAMVIQILVLRQLIAYFQGNELVMGIALGTWMLLTAAGSRTTGWFRSIPGLHLLLALFALFAVILVPLSRHLFIDPGVTAGLDTIMPVLLISLAPFCIVSGMMFPILSEAFSGSSGTGNLHRPYALESIGSLLGGVIFSLIMVYLLDTWQSLVLVMILNLIAASLLYLEKSGKVPAALLIAVALALITVSIVSDPLLLIDRTYYSGQKILSREDTPYGRLVATQLQDQVNIYQNGMPLSQPNDVASREERVHYVMLLKPEARRVLMISGGTGGALEEMLKYENTEIDYVEVDPYLIKMVEQYSGLPDDPRVHYIFQDPVKFIDDTQNTYDVILVNAPDPASGLLNRLYTVSFYRQLKQHLAEDGILQVALSGGANYLSREALLMHSIVYNSLKKEFPIIGLVPGGRNYFLAMETNPNMMLGEAYEKAGIENQYVNPYYINEMQLGQRSRKIIEQLDQEAGMNTDIRPLGYYLRINEWLNHFNIPAWGIPALLGLVLIIFFLVLGPLNLGLFAGGLSAASAEFMLLLWLQVAYGYVYQLVGLVFTLFMAGLALGSWYLPGMFKQFSYRTFLLFQLLMSALLFIITAYIILSHQLDFPGWLNMGLILLLTFIAGSVMGLQYTSSVRLRKGEARKNVALSYSSDLAGSAIGTMIVSIFLVPVVGMIYTGFGLAVFGLLVVAVLFLRKY